MGRFGVGVEKNVHLYPDPARVFTSGEFLGV